ncbi:MAG TPA: hypothetical protein VNA25_02085 [Phycisphaerae bacterium]|nr:hypothetical protein [Phycisphaerae bacterium]
MGEARCRGTKEERAAEHRGKPSRWRDVWPLKPVKVEKRRSAVPKRARSKQKRAVKRQFMLGRRALGSIGSGKVAPPAGYEMAMYRAKVGSS